MTQETRKRKSWLLMLLGGMAAVLLLGIVIKDENGTPLLGTFLETTKTRLNVEPVAGNESAGTEEKSVESSEPASGDTGQSVEAAQSGNGKEGENAADSSGSIKTQESADVANTEDEEAAAKEEKPEIALLTEEETSAVPDNSSLAEDTGPAEFPVFEVLRVEKDGSVVVAGRAPVNSDIEIIEGEKVLGNGKSNAAGEFAIVFDEPLPVGDHDLYIRAKPESGKEVTSQEAGVVSIPEPGGLLFAMIAKPGEASRIVQKPTVLDGTLGKDDAKDAVSTPAEDLAQEAEPKSSQEPEIESAGEMKKEAAPKVVVKQNSRVLVEAIDVEPDSIFVAGTGDPGKKVNVYINNIFMGSTEVGEEGSFLFSSDDQLLPGEHSVRVDMMDSEQNEVVARAEVVLEHEASEEEKSMAALDAGEPAATTSGNAEEPAKQEAETTKPQENTTQPQAADQSGSQEGSAKVEMKGTVQPAEPAETETSVAGAKEPETGDNGSDGSNVQAVDSKKQDVASDQSPPSGNKDEAQAKIPVTPEKQAAKSPQKKSAAKRKTGKKKIAGRKIARKKKTRRIKSGQSIIIRRGDNLWTISRRMLGAGRRYTTIYAANSDQIKNPHLIFPGQVLKIPKG